MSSASWICEAPSSVLSPIRRACSCTRRMSTSPPPVYSPVNTPFVVLSLIEYWSWIASYAAPVASSCCENSDVRRSASLPVRTSSDVWAPVKSRRAAAVLAATPTLGLLGSIPGSVSAVPVRNWSQPTSANAAAASTAPRRRWEKIDRMSLSPSA
jgi:hypothetical protein